MNNPLDKEITYSSLTKFALPTILSMICMNAYSSIDSIFVSRLIGTEALSAVNLLMPLLSIVLAVGAMISTGGSALIAKDIGEGNVNEARQNFSTLTIVAFVISGLASILAFVFIKQLLSFLGADPSVYLLCYEYAKPILILLPFIMVGIIFQQFFITIGKPNLGLSFSIIGGALNIILDYILILKFELGVGGAAIATGIGYSIPALFGLIFFSYSKKNTLYFVKPKYRFKVLYKSCSNGASEMITMMSTSITMLVINNILMYLSGPSGVAAISIIYISQGMLSSIYLGYSFGISPIISYNYGKGDYGKLKKIYSISLSIIGVISIITTCIGAIFASNLVGLFTAPGSNVYNMAVIGFRISCVGFLFIGFNEFSSAMFTALNDGKTSGILSFFRTMVFVLISSITLPYLLGITGIWVSIPFSESLAILMTIYYFKKMKYIYKYS